MGLKIEKDVLLTFLNKVKMAGSQALTEVVLCFGEEGLRACKNSESMTSRVEGTLSKEAFTEYEAVGDVSVRRLDVLVKLFNRFTGEINIEVEGNIMTISKSNKTVGMELVADGVINKDENSPDLQYDNTFTFDSKELKSIFDDAKLSDNASLVLEVHDGTVTFTNTGRYKFTNTYEKPECKVDSKTKVGKPFIDSVTNLDGEVTIKTRTDNPIEISSKGDNEEIKIIVAPMVED